jgi:hypothetical protein
MLQSAFLKEPVHLGMHALPYAPNRLLAGAGAIGRSGDA